MTEQAVRQAARETASPAGWVRRGIAFTFGAALVGALVWLVVSVFPVIVLVFAAILLAAGLQPMINWLRSHLPLGRVGSILLTYGAFFASVVAVAFVAVPLALNQLDDFVQGLPKLFDQAGTWAGHLQPRMLSSSVTSFIDAASRQLRPTPPNVGQVVEAGLSIAEAVVSLVTVLTLIFFWLSERARIQRYVLAFLPIDRRAGIRQGWNDVEARLGLWVRGQLMVMGSIALMTGILYAVVGLPSPLLLGIIAGLAEAIPLVGPILGAIPAVFVSASISPELVAVVAIVYIVIQFVESNVLVPMIMRNTIGLSPFLVIVSLLIGAGVGGIPGAFLAVPVAAATEVLLERLQVRDVPVSVEPDVGGNRREDKSPTPDRSAEAL